MKLHGDDNFREKHHLHFIWGSKKFNNTTRNQNYGDFKSNSTLGERKPKKLTANSTLFKKDIALVWLLSWGKSVSSPDWGIWDRGIKPPKPNNQPGEKSEPRLNWGKWDYMPNIAPYINWYKLQLSEKSNTRGSCTYQQE